MRDDYGQLAPWQLDKRPIPLLYEREQLFLKLMRSSSGEGDALFEKGHCLELRNEASEVALPLAGIHVEAGQQLWLELDAGELITAYPQLKLLGGR